MPDRNSMFFDQFCWWLFFVLFNAEHVNMEKKPDPNTQNNIFNDCTSLR